MKALVEDAPPPEPPAAGQRPGAEAAAQAPINILIVDDEPANLLVLETLLDDPGYRIIRAESADRALLALVEHEFALLILDIRMPVMTGFELAQLIKQRRKTATVPIIFLTAYYDKDQHAVEGYGSGAVDFLSKPVQPHVLRSKVAVFADLYRKTRALSQANQALLAEVAERRHAEQQLRELNETLEGRVEERTKALLQADRRLQTLMNSITDGLLMLDGAWRFTYVNEQGARLLGRSREALLGSSIGELFADDGDSPMWAGLRQAVGKGQAESFEIAYPGPPGAARWLQCHCYPSAEGVSVYFHDISDRHEIEARQKQLLSAEQAARSESERIAREKDEFLAVLSHELRTPLAAILGWTRLVARTDVDAATLRRGIDAIERNAQVQAKLVSDLLDMGRIVSGKLRVDAEPVDLNAIAAFAADTARPAAQAKGVVLDLRLADAEPALSMRGDPGRLQQVASNLLSNALKFTHAGGTVTISAAGTEREVLLSVRDTGEGVAPDFLPHLFKRFSQADGSSSRQHGGLGLGLAIVKNIVEAHGGTIEAHSEGPGRGAVFTARFPRLAAAPAAAAGAIGLCTEPAHAADASPHADTVLQGVSVLLVDDHIDVLELHSRALSDFGASVRAATSAEEALAHLGRERFDVLFSDLGMRGTDGYALIRTVRSTLGLPPEALPAAAVTAFSRPEDRERALEAGFQEVIAKPVYPTTLVSAAMQLRRKPGAPAKLRILYVEDNDDVRELMGLMLREQGLDVVESESAEAAAAALEGGRFDVILTDVRLGELSGIDLARSVLAREPAARIIFCTGYSVDQWLHALGPNVRALPKAFTPEELWAVLDEVGAVKRPRG